MWIWVSSNSLFYLHSFHSVTIFTMNKFITPHMVEKLDRSAYVHEVKKDSDKEESGADSEETEDEADSDDYESDE